MSDFLRDPGGAPLDEGVLVLTTWPADRDAADLAALLVEGRLAACVNVVPAMRSFYRWQGSTQISKKIQELLNGD